MGSYPPILEGRKVAIFFFLIHPFSEERDIEKKRREMSTLFKFLQFNED